MATMIVFQSTHPRGVRQKDPQGTVPRDNISIHAPTWGATRPSVHRITPALISIHAPTWGATECYVGLDLASKFQSTHPRGVRQVLSYQREAFGLFQSTHPRGVRRMMFAQRMWGNGISIHAPTWGATSDHDSDGNDDSISIHAPTWGATQESPKRKEKQCISIHAPTWGATHRLPAQGVWRLISIHAPTWGATTGIYKDIFTVYISIHAPTWGATIYSLLCRQLLTFQSTHPRGVRRQILTLFIAFSNFNPRTHVGCDC